MSLNTFTKLVQFVVILSFGGCTRIIMDVRSYTDPLRNLVQYKTFATVNTNKENPLLEKELLNMITNDLIKRGYQVDKKNPDFVIVLNYYIGPFNYYVPPTNIVLPEYVPGQTSTYSGFVGNQFYWGSETTPGHTAYRTHVSPGYYATAYYRNLTVSFVDFWPLKNFGKVELIWNGTVDSSGSKSDLREVASYLFEELLSEFPLKSGKDSKREIILSEQENYQESIYNQSRKDVAETQFIESSLIIESTDSHIYKDHPEFIGHDTTINAIREELAQQNLRLSSDELQAQLIDKAHKLYPHKNKSK